MSAREMEVTDKMRAILSDWMVDVHTQFRLLPQTLFLAINLLDRYLQSQKTSQERLQLLGASVLMVAAKYEETLYPETKDIEFITEGCCKADEVLKMEGEILGSLGFAVTVVTPCSLLEIFVERLKEVYDTMSKGLVLPPPWKNLKLHAEYILELQMAEYKMLKYLPSVLTAGSLYLSWKVFKTIEPRRRILDWPQEMNDIVRHTEREIRDCAKDLYVIMKNAERNPLQAVRRKYMSEEYGKVALIKAPEETGKKPHTKVVTICNFKAAR
eukprot:TRINITY_DN3528_c0_g1_i2.p2 TRINITY_DN3528_c0_g1~~TRINITY_DN3528_c0_g1_i2.p2  ORF type:complete len:270 (-),score=55.35 TRINITY_DN3528_c0_g1_i2:1028-1837(-)